MENHIYEKAKSKSQQRLMGMVHSYQKGDLDLKDLSASMANKIKNIADGKKGKKGKKGKGISKKDAKDFASTKHKNLPEKVKESFDAFNEEFKYAQTDNFKEAKSIEEIAEIHKFDLGKLQKFLEVGIKIEREHVKNDQFAERIALQHLEELPLYYHKTLGVPAMERRLEELEKIYEEEFTNEGVLDYFNKENKQKRKDVKIEKAIKNINELIRKFNNTLNFLQSKKGSSDDLWDYIEYFIEVHSDLSRSLDKYFRLFSVEELSNDEVRLDEYETLFNKVDNAVNNIKTFRFKMSGWAIGFTDPRETIRDNVKIIEKHRDRIRKIKFDRD